MDMTGMQDGYVLNVSTRCIERWVDGRIVEFVTLYHMDDETFKDFAANFVKE